MRELETIRNFLTGQGLTSLLDLVFTLVFFGVMFIYSAKLTLIVLFATPVYVIVASVLGPILRGQVKEKFNRGARSQQFLVESIVGAQTLKAASVEPMMRGNPYFGKAERKDHPFKNEREASYYLTNYFMDEMARNAAPRMKEARPAVQLCWA